MTTVHDFSVRTADGSTQDLAEYAGRPLLLVNVASKCGFTPQYAGLEQVHRDKPGLQILGFPCNQFGDQEPGTDEEIQQFCTANYDVTFPVLGKIDVNGADADPLYAFLRAEAPGDFGPDNGLYEHISAHRPQAIGTDEVKWNFTKFLVDGEGHVVRRYESTDTPQQIAADVDALLE